MTPRSSINALKRHTCNWLQTFAFVGSHLVELGMLLNWSETIYIFLSYVPKETVKVTVNQILDVAKLRINLIKTINARGQVSYIFQFWKLCGGISCSKYKFYYRVAGFQNWRHCFSDIFHNSGKCPVVNIYSNHLFGKKNGALCIYKLGKKTHITNNVRNPWPIFMIPWTKNLKCRSTLIFINKKK